MNSLAIYPGSFDPITLGHISVAIRAAKVFSAVQIVVVHNPNKVALFSVEERVSMIHASLADVSTPSNISVSTLESGLLAEYASAQAASAIVKGFRTSADVEYELPMAKVNLDISAIETVFLPAEPGLGFVSSSLVKEVARLGGPIEHYVTSAVRAELERKLQN